MAITIKQGDAFAMPIKVSINGAPVAAGDVTSVEFMFGDVRKTYPEDGYYNAEDGSFYIRLKQEDTLALPADDTIMLDTRVKFNDGSVVGVTKMTPIMIVDATSEVVI